MKNEISDGQSEALRSSLALERELTARLTRDLNQERLRNDLIEADKADLIQKLKEIRRLQALSEDLLVENNRYRELVAKALGVEGETGGDVLHSLDAYFRKLEQIRERLTKLQLQGEEDRRRYEANEAELQHRLDVLKAELLRVQTTNEEAYVPRSVFDPVFERLKDLEQEVEDLRIHRMESIPLLQEREAIINSTAWKLTSAPRKLLTLLRQRRHG